MVDFNNLLSRFVLAAPRALNDEVAQGQMVVCTQMSIAGSAASFTVKIIMNAGTGRDLAEQLAQPQIKGLLGLTASAAEPAAAPQAEQSVHATKTYTARQTVRFYPGWQVSENGLPNHRWLLGKPRKMTHFYILTKH